MDIRTVITWADGTVSADNATERAARLAAALGTGLTLLVPRQSRHVRHPQHWDQRVHQLERRHAVPLHLRPARSLAQWLDSTAPGPDALVVCDEPAAPAPRHWAGPLLVVKWHYAMRHDRVLVAAPTLPGPAWRMLSHLVRDDAAVDVMQLAGHGPPSAAGALPGWRLRSVHATDCRRNRRLDTGSEVDQIANHQDFVGASLVVARLRPPSWLDQLWLRGSPAPLVRRLPGDLLLVTAH